MVTCVGVRHGWSHLREVIQEFKLANDLILNGSRQGFQFFDGPRGRSLTFLPTPGHSGFEYGEIHALASFRVALGFR